MELKKIEIVPTPNGQVIVLPYRDLNTATRAGWLGIAIGIIGTLFMLVWIAGPAVTGIKMLVQREWFGLLPLGFSLLGIPGVFFTTKILALGNAVLQNKLFCEVSVTDSEVVSRERFGWFSHRTKIPVDQISELYLLLAVPEIESSDQHGQVPPFISQMINHDWYLISTAKQSGSIIAPGYSLETLQSVTATLKKQLDKHLADRVKIHDGFFAEKNHENATTEVSIIPPSDRLLMDEQLNQPENSVIQVVQQDGATVYRVPSKGVWKGSHGLMFFSLAWLGFMVIFTPVMILDLPGEIISLLLTIGFLAVFWSVGLAMLFYSFYLGRQSAMVGIGDGLLFIERTTIFGKKWTEFAGDQILNVKVGPSNMEVNEVPVLELQILPIDDKKVGMLSQLDDAELYWLAAQLRKELGITGDVGRTLLEQYDLSKPITPPVNSLVRVQNDVARVTEIEVPAKGIGSAWFGLLFCSSLALGPLPLAVWLTTRHGVDWFLYLFAAIATLFGITALVFILMHCTRRFNVTANERELRIRRNGFASRKEIVIQAKQIRDIVVADSGVRTNHRPEMQLLIKYNKADQFTMMYGRDENEIAYVVALLLQRLRIEPAAKPA